MSKNKNFEGYKAAFPGESIFTVGVQQLDTNYSEKSKDISISKPAIHASIKAIVVNEIKYAALPGGVEALVVNGGAGENPTLPAGGKFISSMEDVDHKTFSGGSEKKQWFGDYATPKAVAHAINEGEIIRLKAIIADCNSQVKALEAINQANEDASVRYE